MTTNSATRYEDYLTDLSFPKPDLDLAESFHEATKIFPQTIEMDGLWIGSYLSDPRALLETASNRKRYFLSERRTLPKPMPVPGMLAAALRDRLTVQTFTGEGISDAYFSCLLSAAIAPTRFSLIEMERDLRIHKRPYASGGGLYPIEIYPLLLRVGGAAAAVTHYNPVAHELALIRDAHPFEAVMAPLSDIDQRLSGAALIIILTSVFERSMVKYGSRGYRFAMIEAGEIAQNLSLCAQALGLGTLPWGGYFDDELADLLGINGIDEAPVHCLAIGHPAK